jgi:hypothetical protein
MKLKLDENGRAFVIDGKPVVVKDDGSEVAFDYMANVSKIAELKGEVDTLKTSVSEATAKFTAYGDINPEDAAKALEMVKNMKDGVLVDATEISERHKAEFQNQANVFQAKLDASRLEVSKLIEDNRIKTLGSAFANSNFIKDKTTLPADIALATFGHNFKIEDGDLVPYLNGNRILSQDRAGENATFEEGITILIGGYANKDSILKSPNNGGSGAGGGNNNGGGQESPRTTQQKYTSGLEKLMK